MRSARVAVWGASGFVGRQVLARLSACGYRVRALYRRMESGSTNRDVETRSLAFEDPPDNYRLAVDGCDYIVHCAGHAQDVQGLPAYERSVVELIRAASAANVKRLLLLSTVAVYGADRAGTVGVGASLCGESAYAKSRIRAEQLAREATANSATQVVAIRVPAVVGVGMPGTVLSRFFGAIRRGVFAHPGAADATFACLGVHRLTDCVRALLEAGSIPDVCQFADNISWLQLTQLFSEAAGRRIVRIPLPGSIFLIAGHLLRMDGLIHVLHVLDNRVRYEDDAERMALAFDPAVPGTLEDVRAVIGDYLRANGHRRFA